MIDPVGITAHTGVIKGPKTRKSNIKFLMQFKDDTEDWITWNQATRYCDYRPLLGIYLRTKDRLRISY